MARVADAFEQILSTTRQAFAQDRTFVHARRLAYGFAVAWGRRTISRSLCATNDQFHDWSASYRFFSRSPWRPAAVFQPVLAACLRQGEGPFVVAMDDTTFRKTGRRIPGVAYLHDPASPPFAPSFMRAQRFIQASAMLRPEGVDGSARAVPVRLQPAPPPAKPGRRAEEAAWLAYRGAQKTQNLSMKGSLLISDLRDSMDQEGYGQRTLLVAVDGSYCNRTVLRQLPGRVQVVARARGDIRLFRPLSSAGAGDHRRKYGAELPRPQEVLADQTIPWRTARVFGAGRVHELTYKTVAPVLWRSGTKDKLLRLFVIRPLRYRRESAALSSTGTRPICSPPT
ncbi:MAG: transposase [Sulfobacillus sp.]